MEGRGNAGYLAFVGEPLILRVTLSNDSPEPLRVAARESWAEALRLDFEPDARGDGASPTEYSNVPLTVERIRGAIDGGAVDPLTVGAHQAQEATLQAAAGGGGSGSVHHSSRAAANIHSSSHWP